MPTSAMDAAWLWTGWSVPVLGVVAMMAVAAVHWRGWRRLRGGGSGRWTWARWSCMPAGLCVLAVALWSPLDAWGQWLLAAHMVQHLLIAMVVPPLLLLAWPMAPLVAGMPRWMSRGLFGPLLAWPPLRRAASRLVHPLVAWPLAVIATWAWHVPVAYEWALRSPWAHALEHACFLWTGVLFWWPVVQPWPWKGSWPRWTMAIYLLSADVANTLVAAVMAFAGEAIYPMYRETAPALGVPALVDQQRAAVIMWLPGSLLYLVPAVVILVRALTAPRAPRVVSLAVLGGPRPPRGRWDATRVPWLGRFLHSARARLGLRLVMLGIAAVVVLDGFLGPDHAATNIAGTWPWTHGRGLAAVAVLLAGNLACMGCPLIAPRTLLRRWVRPRWRWPARWRGKWLVAALVLAWLVAYESLAWWDSPWLTAWLIVGMVLAATVTDLLFQGSSFCQWICPVGQWNMAMGMAAPVEVTVRDAQVCVRCTTQDCIRGGPAGPGCGTGLFLPRKVGNMECTWCMDCVTACPHDNAAVSVTTPFRETAWEGTRAAIGRWAERTDLAALLLVLGAGGIVHALLMTEPVAAWSRGFMEAWSRPWAVAALTLLAMAGVALPVVVAATAGRILRGQPFLERLAGLVLDLWPLGVTVWLVHFGFHLVTGWASALPPLQRAMREGTGLDLGEPQWATHCCAHAPGWLMPAMLWAMGAGCVLSLWLAWRRAIATAGGAPALGAVGWWIPDAAVTLIWWAISVWVVLQPMEMRGLLA